MIGELNARDCDALLIPEAFIKSDLLRQSAEAYDLVREFDDQRNPIATLCYGPWLLATATMRLMPKGSMGSVLGIALIGGGFLAAS